MKAEYIMNVDQSGSNALLQLQAPYFYLLKITKGAKEYESTQWEAVGYTTTATTACTFVYYESQSKGGRFSEMYSCERAWEW